MTTEPNRHLEAAVERMRQAERCGPDWACLLYRDDVDRQMVDDVAMIVRAYLLLPPPDNGPTWEGLVDAAARSTAQREASTAAELSGNSGQLTPPEDVFRVTDGQNCYSCEAFGNFFLLRPEDGSEPWITFDLARHGLRKC